jgi:hypothetical protein
MDGEEPRRQRQHAQKFLGALALVCCRAAQRWLDSFGRERQDGLGVPQGRVLLARR